MYNARNSKGIDLQVTFSFLASFIFIAYATSKFCPVYNILVSIWLWSEPF